MAKDSGPRLSGPQAEIMRWVRAKGEPVTDRQIMAGLGLDNIKRVGDHVKGLIGLRQLAIEGDTKCPVLHKKVRVVGLPKEKQLPQKGLFQEGNNERR